MEAVGEVDHVLAAGGLAGDLERGLDRVGAGRAGELHDVVVKAARRQDDVVHRLEELLLGGGVQVEAVGDAVLHDVVDERGLEDRVVVPVVERAGAGQEIEIALAVDVAQLGAAGVVEQRREAAGVGAHVRLQPQEDFVVVGLGVDLVRHGVLLGPFAAGDDRRVHDQDPKETGPHAM